LGIQPKMGGRFHLKLNIVWKPIEKKYSDGMVKRTLKKGLKVLEIVGYYAGSATVVSVIFMLITRHLVLGKLWGRF